MYKRITAATVLVLAFSACGSSPGTDAAGNSVKKTTSSTTQSASPSDTPSDTSTDTPTGPTYFAIGEKATVTQNGADAATVMVSNVEAYTKPGGQFGEAPKNGVFKIITLTVRAIGTDTFDINPFDFYMRDAEGTRYQPSDGNALMSGYERQTIDATTLNPNEQVKGAITFDVPAAARELVYAPGDQSLAIWKVK